MYQISQDRFNTSNISWMRIMWILVFFDLPVTTFEERKSATKFRNDLLDMGFLMAQFSVYYKLAGTRENAEKLSKEIEKMIPAKGIVNILTITDKQYSNMLCIVGQKKEKVKAHEQLLLF